MFRVFSAALRNFLGIFLKQSTMKWSFVTMLFSCITLLFDLLLDLLPAWFSTDGLSSATSAFTPSVWYFIDYFNIQLGLSMTLSAWAIRFIIRRIPFIG